MRIAVDPSTCNGYGNCVASVPEVFAFDEDGTSYVLAECTDAIPDELVDSVAEAVLHCPQQAIRYVEE